MFAWPVLRIQSDIPGATALPPDSESRQGYDLLLQRFDAAALSPIEVLVTWDGEQDPFAPANLKRLYDYGQALEATPRRGPRHEHRHPAGHGVGRRRGRVLEGGRSRVRDSPRAGDAADEPGPDCPASSRGCSAPSRSRARRSSPPRPRRRARLSSGSCPRRRRPPRRPRRWPSTSSEAGGPPGTTTYVAGASLTVHDFVDAIYSRFPWIIAFVVGVTGLVLLLMLRSVVLPVKAVIMNVCSLLAGYGAMVWIFQEGHLEGLFQFTATGAIDAELPVVLFCTVFGVSMDYEVFLLSRMREEWDATHDNIRAVSFGLARTGRIVTSAALIIVVVGLSFAFTSIVITKAIGIGLAVAVALDATVIRVLMVPAAMRLLGRWNWWLPRWLGWLPHIE